MTEVLGVPLWVILYLSVLMVMMFSWTGLPFHPIKYLRELRTDSEGETDP